MKITLKLVDKCPDDHRGEFVVIGRNRCEIQISKRHNKTVNEFAATLLHELLHLWVTILQTHGLKEGIRREHKFINKIVPTILNRLSKDYK